MANRTETTDGAQFEFSPNNKRYLCSKHHRGSGDPNHKSIWSISEEQEFEIFCESDKRDWVCDDGHYWGIGSCDGDIVIGTDEQRLAKFPKNDNETVVPWHGYPVSPRDSKTFPPTPFVRKWLQQGAVSRHFGKKIMKGLI